MTTVIMPATHPVSSSFSIAGYRDVDAASDQWAYYGYLDSVAYAFRDVIDSGIEQLRLTPGQSVVDIGCGHGSAAALLARRVGRTGRVVGLDASQAMIAEARRRCDAGDLRIDFEVGDAAALPFADATFDAARVDRVFMFLDDPAKALCELMRITKPGGRVAVTEGDVGSHLIDAADTGTTREIMSALSDLSPNAWIGRRLRGMFLEAGLHDVDLQLAPVLTTSYAEWNNRMGVERFLPGAIERGILARESACAWLEDIKARDACGRFTGVAMLYTAVGTVANAGKAIMSSQLAPVAAIRT